VCSKKWQFVDLHSTWYRPAHRPDRHRRVLHQAQTRHPPARIDPPIKDLTSQPCDHAAKRKRPIVHPIHLHQHKTHHLRTPLQRQHKLLHLLRIAIIRQENLQRNHAATITIKTAGLREEKQLRQQEQLQRPE